MENKELQAATNEAIVGEMMGKKWYVSKTFWANVVAGLAVVGQMKYGFIVTPEVQMLALAGINVVLRKVSKEPIIW